MTESSFQEICDSTLKMNVDDIENKNGKSIISEEWIQYKQYEHYWSLGEYSKCLTIIKKLLTNYPMNPIYHLRYAQYLYRKQNCAVSIIQFYINKALELIRFAEFSFQIVDIYKFAAKYYREMQNDIKTAEYNDQMARKIHHDPQSHYKDAKRLCEIGENKLAEYHLKKSIKLNQGNETFMSPYFMYYHLLKTERRYSEALEQIQICLKYRQNNYFILFEYGTFLCKYMKQYDEGLKYLEKAKQLNYGNISRKSALQNDNLSTNSNNTEISTHNYQIEGKNQISDQNKMDKSPMSNSHSQMQSKMEVDDDINDKDNDNDNDDVYSSITPVFPHQDENGDQTASCSNEVCYSLLYIFVIKISVNWFHVIIKFYSLNDFYSELHLMTKEWQTFITKNFENQI